MFFATPVIRTVDRERVPFDQSREHCGTLGGIELVHTDIMLDRTGKVKWRVIALR